MQAGGLQRFDGHLVDHSGNKVELSKVTNKKLVGLYFSAHWCPPCRGFTPILSEFYNTVKASHPDELEIIFVSSDKDEKSFKEYFGEMPWISLEFGNALKGTLGQEFGVNGIPFFVILKADGTLVTKEGRADVQAKGEQAVAGWLSK